jgi:hypothetical protein
VIKSVLNSVLNSHVSICKTYLRKAIILQKTACALTFIKKFALKKYLKKFKRNPMRKKDLNSNLFSEISWLFDDINETSSENKDDLCDFTYVKPC